MGTGLTDRIKDGSPCWCGHRSWLAWFRTSRFGLLRCSSCGVFRIDPPPLRSDGESAHFYSRYYGDCPTLSTSSRTSGVRSSRFWRVCEQVPALNSPGTAALDFGCGEGTLCAELKEAGWTRVIGVDASSIRIARAKARCPEAAFFDVPLACTGLQTSSLDLVVMDNVVEHLVTPVDLLSALHGYLKSSGRLLLITPNMESGNFRLLGRRWTPELAPHAHIYLFTAETICRLLQRCGFEVDSVGSFHLPPYAVGEWLARLGAGDVKGAVWRALQELGGLYGRLIGRGPMLYALARPA